MTPHAVIQRVRTFMRDNGYSESALSRLTGIPQSTIHRSLKNPLRLTKTHRTLCKFADIELTSATANLEVREELIQEVLDIWDGSREHAHSLGRLLRAAAALQTHGANQASRPR